MRLVRIALLCSASLALLAAPAAHAGERRARHPVPKSGEVSRTVTRTGADGTSRTSTHDTKWERGDGRWTRDTVHTGPNGKQATTHVDGARTENGTTRDITHTRPDGSTVTKQVTRQVTPVTESAPSAD